MEIIVATSNKHKIEEIGKILKARGKGQDARVKETGETFEENAIIKAEAVWERYKKQACSERSRADTRNKQIIIADDSGLIVDCLGGKPGIKSARYATPPTPDNLCKKLLKAMLNCKNRKAKFVCAIAIVFPNGKIKIVKGIVHGRIAHGMRGNHGFGYDAVFIPRGFRKTFAEMKPSQKNKLSHRYRALQKVKAILF